jgi:alpha-ribazole phosphatase
MSKRLLLVRHGQIEAGYLGRFIGSTDVGLDPTGLAQAAALAARVARYQPDLCYCSPGRRCRETAAAMHLELPLHLEVRLHEVDFGEWERQTFEAISRAHPDLVARWMSFTPEFTFPGGENLGEFIRRVRGAAEWLRYTDVPTVLAITHGGVIRMMLCQLLGLDLRKYVAFDVGYASLAVIDLFEDGGVLAALERGDMASHV